MTTTNFTFNFINSSSTNQVGRGSFTVDYTAGFPQVVVFSGEVVNTLGGTLNFSLASVASVNPSTSAYLFTADAGAGNQMEFYYVDNRIDPPSVVYGAPPAIEATSIGVARFFVGSDAGGSTFTCFARNTLISTPTGSTPVQDLQIGDLILNHQGQTVPVKWIGIQRFHPAFIPEGLPVRISAGALGNGLPVRDLFVSPGHAMYLDDGVLVDAKALINGTTITQVTQWKGDVEYFHIETEHHEIILAEGAPAETFMDNVARTCFNNHAEYEALYPTAHEMVELDIPRISHQRQLPNTIKNKLDAVATSLIGNEAAVKAA